MSWKVSCALAVTTCALRAAAPPGAPFTVGQALFTEDFGSGLARWSAEFEKPGKVEAGGGVLAIDVPAGCTLWFRPELEGAVMIQYEARMVQAGGPNDRVSDLNAFWMATDARSPDDLFATHRSGKFADYNQLRAYYVGLGGNTNTTTRFRRYIGDTTERPLLPEHDLRSAGALLQPNQWQTVQLVALGNRIQYYRDGELLFDFIDPAPYTRGRFGFRTTFSHVELRNFRVFRITPKKASFQAIYRYLDDAKAGQRRGAAAWPFQWVSMPEYAKARGTLTGACKLRGETAKTGTTADRDRAPAEDGDGRISRQRPGFARNVRTLSCDAGLLHEEINEITLGHFDAWPFPPDGNVRGTVDR